ncbi:NADase-type glycan-binding domain-containing protein [Paenibacillus sp. FSL L8-0463]|uniref:NADase-type glycan-binding domain-containing protein n=1 Tax=Paenibacillus sp. FSL L8-0463 TaxID=2954687 RepID=UPI003119486E
MPIQTTANGGPGDISPDVQGGGMKFTQKKNIILKEENLSFIIKGDTVDITAAYTLFNKGGADKTAYIFPIHFYVNEHGCEPNCDFKADNFRITDGNKLLPIKNERTTKIVNQVIEDEYIVQKVTREYITEINFAKGETKKLTVRYSVNAGFYDWMISGQPLVIFGDRHFSYDVAPAGYWGNGRAGKLNITFDYRDIVMKGGSPIRLSLPYGKETEKGLLKLQLENTELKKLGQLEFKYEYEAYLLSKHIRASKIPISQFKSAIASTELGKEYEITNMFDGKLNTAWVEGAKGTGIGETITLELKPGTYVDGVRIINGYMKSKESYENNARIKTIRLSYLMGNSEWITEDVDLADLPFDSKKAADQNSIYLLSQQIGQIGQEVSKIKLTILSTYPGKKFADTCVSELIVLK